MHHIEDINGVVKGMANLIKDDGIIITEDPSLLEMLKKMPMIRFMLNICTFGLYQR